MEVAYIRGSQISFIVVPSMLSKAPFFNRIKKWREFKGNAVLGLNTAMINAMPRGGVFPRGGGGRGSGGRGNAGGGGYYGPGAGGSGGHYNSGSSSNYSYGGSSHQQMPPRPSTSFGSGYGYR